MSLEGKYKMPRHELDYYHDPQTGLLKLKENFEQDKIRENQRDFELQRNICEAKIK